MNGFHVMFNGVCIGRFESREEWAAWEPVRELIRTDLERYRGEFALADQSGGAA